MVLAMMTDKRDSAGAWREKGGSVYRGTHLYSLLVRKVLLHVAHVHSIVFELVVPEGLGLDRVAVNVLPSRE